MKEIELEDVLIDTKENQNENDSLSSKSEIENFTLKEESELIKADIQLLKEMGYNEKVINKIYILIRPENIERAIDLMTPINGIYHHDFYENYYKHKNQKLCFICGQPKNLHFDYQNKTPDINNENEIINNDIENNNIINNNIIINDKFSSEQNDLICKVCYETLNEEEKKFNFLPCGHINCTECWINNLKTLISEAKVEQIKCMEYQCNQSIDENFILKHIKNDHILLEKYDKFKIRMEIIKNPNKKQCPQPNCESFLEKKENNNFIKCQKGHEFCFDCLRPWHKGVSCEKIMEKEFLKWIKIKY